MRRGILRSILLAFAVVALLLVGLSIAPLRSGATDASFTDLEKATPSTAITTATLPSITMLAQGSSGGSSMTVAWKFNGTAPTGTIVNFTATATGLSLTGNPAVTQSINATNGMSGGTNTASVSSSGLPIAVGATMTLTAVTTVPSATGSHWSVAALNSASASYTCVIGCSFGTPTVTTASQ